MGTREFRYDLGGVRRGSHRSTVNLAGDPDIRCDILDLDSFCEDGTVTEFYLSHTLEHIPADRYTDFILHMKRKLRPGGEIRVVQTDIGGVLELYASGALSFRAMRCTIITPADRVAENPLQQHHGMWSAEELRRDFEQLGFEAQVFDAGSWRYDMYDELFPAETEGFHGVPIPNLGVVARRPAADVEDECGADRSENGESAYLLKVCRSLGYGDGTYYCLEVGAGDGESGSNTYLFRTLGWDAVLIEADAAKLARIRQAPGGSGLYPLKSRVSLEPGERLDELLALTPIPAKFPLASIDIDGNDLHVWESMEAYRPSVLVIEFNEGWSGSKVMPYDPSHRWDGTDYYGASREALVALASKKGYALVNIIGPNIIFVSEDEVGAVPPDLKPWIGAGAFEALPARHRESGRQPVEYR